MKLVLKALNPKHLRIGQILVYDFYDFSIDNFNDLVKSLGEDFSFQDLADRGFGVGKVVSAPVEEDEDWIEVELEWIVKPSDSFAQDEDISIIGFDNASQTNIHLEMEESDYKIFNIKMIKKITAVAVLSIVTLLGVSLIQK